MRSVEDAVDIGVYIPPMPDKTKHHVISRGQHPDFYRPDDLRDKGEGKTAWVDTFEKNLVALFWATGEPVPFVFRTPDGTIRSLDAGCIKMLLNRRPPDVEIECDRDGFIDSVRPSQRLLDLYAPMQAMLVKRVHEATAED